MTVKELLLITGGLVKYRIEPYDDEYTVLTEGIVDDINFNDVPYGEYEVQHISIDNNEMVVLI